MHHLVINTGTSTVEVWNILRILECVPTRTETTTTFKLKDRDARGENVQITVGEMSNCKSHKSNSSSSSNTMYGIDVRVQYTIMYLHNNSQIYYITIDTHSKEILTVGEASIRNIVSCFITQYLSLVNFLIYMIYYNYCFLNILGRAPVSAKKNKH